MKKARQPRPISVKVEWTSGERSRAWDALWKLMLTETKEKEAAEFESSDLLPRID